MKLSFIYKLIFIILFIFSLNQNAFSEKSNYQQLSLIEKNKFQDIRIKLFKEIAENSTNLDEDSGEFSFSFDTDDKNSFFYGIPESELINIFKLKTNKFNSFDMITAIGITSEKRALEFNRANDERNRYLTKTGQISDGIGVLDKMDVSANKRFVQKNYKNYNEYQMLLV